MLRTQPPQRLVHLLSLLVSSALAMLAMGLAGCSSTGATPGNSGVVRVTMSPIEETSAPQPEAEEEEESALDDLATADLGEGPDLDPEPVDGSTEEDLLARSLSAYESAGELWKQGDFEGAFDALDEAYQLMSETAVDLEEDPVLAQQKEDLRHLVSRRVVEIYASRQTAVGDLSKAIPVVINDQVRREIESFQGRERQAFLEGYRRSGLYRPMITQILREEGLPEQLSWLPMVESWYKVRALSTARALGMWQFISSTGYRYGLERTQWVDERMDPVKSTHAAAGYLTDLHQLFGDWLTALAAYNSGEGRVLRRINEQREGYFDRFWDLYERLPQETRRYVPRFLATLAIVEDPEAYGFTDLPEPLTPPAVTTYEVERSVRLDTLDQALGLAPGTLKALNPELRQDVLPERLYPLQIPAEVDLAALGTLDDRLAELPAAPPPPAAATTHRVRRGESLSLIASRYGTSVGDLVVENNLRSANRITPGQVLRIPSGGSSGRRAAATPSPQPTTHVVRQGDSLWRIASRYGTTTDRIRRDNGLGSNTLRPGQRLTIHQGTAGSTSRTYTVRRGDTLGAIASRHRVSLSRLLGANRLSRRSTIHPGQTLVIPQ